MASGDTKRPTDAGGTHAPTKRRKTDTGADASVSSAAGPRLDVSTLPPPLLKLIFTFMSSEKDGRAYTDDQLYSKNPVSPRESA